MSEMAQSSWKCYCSVPFCYNNKQKFPYLSFHDFPSDPDQRYLWVEAIKRNKMADFRVQRGSTYVCSQHFKQEDLRVSLSGRTRIRPGAVPSRFQWNDWGKESEAHKSLDHEDQDPHRLEQECMEEDTGEAAVSALENDHCYAQHPSLGKEDGEAHKMMQLQIQALSQNYKIKHLTLQNSQPLLHKFCVTDEDVQHFCKFSSKEVLSMFWDLVSPTAFKLSHSTKSHRSIQESQKLQLIDQFFMFLCRIAAGLQENTLSGIFKVSVSTVRIIVKKWTSYLYQILGSLPTWKTRNEVFESMPDKVKKYCPKVRVIIHSTEICCETNLKKYTTVKGLIGISPSGIITFVSQLYPGSISNLELAKKSRILQLVDPGDGVIANADFFTDAMLSEVGAVLIVPPLKKSCDLIEEEVQLKQAIAHLKAPAERAIRRVKEYHIWDEPVPLGLSGLFHQLWAVCCLLSNYQETLKPL